MHEVSTLTYFPLKPGCEGYFLDKAVADFEHDLDSTKMPELDASFDKPDVTSSVSSRFPCSTITVTDNSKVQLAPSTKSHKLLCQARVLLLPVQMAGKMSTSKLIHYFSSHPEAFGFKASSPPDITLNLAKKKTSQSFS